MKNQAVFLDRDNTLIEDTGYVYKTSDLKWKNGAKSALVHLSKMGFVLIVITNQSGVARGYYTEEDVNYFHHYMNEDLFKSKGCRIDKFYFSPFHPEGIVDIYKKHSNCRKPGNELFKKAIKEYNISTSQSIAIGNNNSDIEPALNCGVGRAYLFDNNYNSTIKNQRKLTVVKNWQEIITHIKIFAVNTTNITS